MTVNQARVVFGAYGYDLDKWVCPKEIGSFLLTHDSPCIVNEDYCMVRINSTSNFLEVVLGSLNEDGDFETKKTKETDTSKFTPDWYMDLGEVAGILGRSANNGVLYWTKQL